MIASGLALGTGLLIRSQVVQYVGALLALALAATAPFWWRSHRKLAGALALGFLPAAVLWIAIVRVAGGDLKQIEAFGNFTFRQRYPYGFWQFLDTDGFMGPYRLGQEPFYQALNAEARSSPELLHSYPKQLAFTVRYVASRGSESLLLFLDNIFRLFDRPANDYKWDYPFAYPRQVVYQRAILLLGVAGMAVFLASSPASAGVFFVPSCLALLHGLSYPWPRFNQPAMPILIASAGAFLVWAARERGHRAVAIVLAVLLSASVLLLAAASARMIVPELARILRSSGSPAESPHPSPTRLSRVETADPSRVSRSASSFSRAPTSSGAGRGTRPSSASEATSPGSNSRSLSPRRDSGACGRRRRCS
jgi:hypothetical protein